MAFDQTTRNRLARFVSDCRALLSEEFTRQMQSIYGLDPTSGDVADIDSLTLSSTQYETARLLRETLEHYLAGLGKSDKKARQEVITRIVREQAFTVLNRLCAVRMAESRGLVIQCIGKGYQSKAFQVYKQLVRTSLGEMGDAYRVFLFSVFDEFAVDLPVLFDRFSPQGRLFPRETALLAVLSEINHADIDPLWAEDETIGWIYQYFNSVEERRQMRSESQAPRNSRELAVRNQFFTPRYVVEFLTDNTLGRIWYEMTQGTTALKDSCRYLVRRPNEIFLAEGEESPEQEEPAEDLSQEELLKQPVHIPFRPLKDPRDIKMLDPACGSMHFGLYAFDLFERIYDEAWDLEATGSRGPDAFVRPEGLKPLHETYDSKEAFLRDVPRLIIERNIHGIDIDPRAVQIAGLSLWLRAQKSWQAQGVAAGSRPQIQRSNIVCAEPMPGEADMLEEFLKGLRDDRLESLIRRVLEVPENQQVRATARMAEALCDLVRTVWKEMELAGEAGSLLKIEESLADAIAKSKDEWEAKLPLFRVTEFGLTEETKANPKVKYYKSVPGEEEDFWNRAEALVLEALHDYAEHAQGLHAARKRMFADDAAKGFAFIDLCRTRFDTIVMNPPFGDLSASFFEYGSRHYPRTKYDLGTIFIERIEELSAPGARCGWITSRTWLSRSLLEQFRQDLLYRESRLRLVADLGIGVLDALVETAACIISLRSDEDDIACVMKVLSSRTKEDSLLNAIHELSGQVPVRLADMSALPRGMFGYWLPRSFIRTLTHLGTLEDSGATARQGLATTDDFRFLRLMWEIPSATIGSNSRWLPIAKGGEYEPYYDDIHLAIDYERDGIVLKTHLEQAKGQSHWSRRIASSEYYGRPGLTYPERTTSDFSPRPLPAGCAFTATGQSLFFQSNDDADAYLGLAYSRVYKMLVELFIGSGDASEAGSAARGYSSGTINCIQVPYLGQIRNIGTLARQAREIRQEQFQRDEVTVDFVAPALLAANCHGSIESRLSLSAAEYQAQCLRLLEVGEQIDRLAAQAYGLDNHGLLDAEVCPYPTDYPATDDTLDGNIPGLSELMRQVCEKWGYRRAFTKKAYWSNRLLELMWHRDRRRTMPTDPVALAADSRHLLTPVVDLVSYAIGVSFGRWDARCTKASAPEQRDAYAPIRACAPGTLMLDANSDDAREYAVDFPVKVAWSGIVAADTGTSSTMGTMVVDVLGNLLDISSIGVEAECSQIIGIEGLAVYLSKANGFFAQHLSKYSRSRRYAPIYWPLSTRSESYTLWLYYHRLTDQTLYTCVNDFVEPKLKQVSEEASRLRVKANRSSAEEKELERLSDLEFELKDFRDELLRIAKFWKPNLNDGVQITAAPLWKLFQHRQWQSRLKETWEKLEAGEYDWAHLALSIWPDRVVAASHKDRSYAIAHDLEDQLWHEVEVEKTGRGGRVTTKMEWQPRALSESQLNKLIAEVKAR